MELCPCVCAGGVYRGTHVAKVMLPGRAGQGRGSWKEGRRYLTGSEVAEDLPFLVPVHLWGSLVHPLGAHFLFGFRGRRTQVQAAFLKWVFLLSLSHLRGTEDTQRQTDSADDTGWMRQRQRKKNSGQLDNTHTTDSLYKGGLLSARISLASVRWVQNEGFPSPTPSRRKAFLMP